MTNQYYQAIGRRKTAVARVRLSIKKGTEVVVNDKKMEDYFPTPELAQTAISPLTKMDFKEYHVSAKIKGGGVNAQAEALRHGIARALVLIDEESRKRLRKLGFLTRDPRQRERKKFGLKRARRASQWRKR